MNMNVSDIEEVVDGKLEADNESVEVDSITTVSDQTTVGSDEDADVHETTVEDSKEDRRKVFFDILTGWSVLKNRILATKLVVQLQKKGYKIYSSTRLKDLRRILKNYARASEDKIRELVNKDVVEK